MKSPESNSSTTREEFREAAKVLKGCAKGKGFETLIGREKKIKKALQGKSISAVLEANLPSDLESDILSSWMEVEQSLNDLWDIQELIDREKKAARIDAEPSADAIRRVTPEPESFDQKRMRYENASNEIIPHAKKIQKVLTKEFLERYRSIRSPKYLAFPASCAAAGVLLGCFLMEGCDDKEDENRPHNEPKKENVTKTLKTPSVITPNTTQEQVNQMLSQGMKTHVIKGGDTYYSLARRYNISEESLRTANPNFKAKKLPIGKNLNIPASTKKPTSQ